jgi:hypothetical protein
LNEIGVFKESKDVEKRFLMKLRINAARVPSRNNLNNNLGDPMGRLLKLVGVLILLSSNSAFAINDFNLTWYNRTTRDPSTFNSADYKNTVFVLEVYQLRCAPCNTNAANVKALAASYQSNANVKVIDLGIDQDQDSYRQWVLRHQPTHPVLIDTGRTVSFALGTQTTPSTYILDCNKNVRWQHTGVWTQTTLTDINNQIASLSTMQCHP